MTDGFLTEEFEKKKIVYIYDTEYCNGRAVMVTSKFVFYTK